MFKNALKLFRLDARHCGLPSLPGFQVEPLVIHKYIAQEVRTVYILKRKEPPKLKKLHEGYKTLELREENYIYDLVEDTNAVKRPKIKLLLIKPVEGIGLPGDVVEVRINYGRFKLLTQGLAVYASPENLENYKSLQENRTQEVPSSQFAYKTIRELERNVFNVSMNMENPWRVEPWHIKVAFRKANYNVPEHAITLPTQPIEGPNLNVEGKEFLVKVKINKKEEAKVRFRLHHIPTLAINKLPHKEGHYKLLAEPMFEEEAEILAELNRNDPNIMKEEDEEDMYS